MLNSEGAQNYVYFGKESKKSYTQMLNRLGLKSIGFTTGPNQKRFTSDFG